jgi:hypothetical protein
MIKKILRLSFFYAVALFSIAYCADSESVDAKGLRGASAKDNTNHEIERSLQTNSIVFKLINAVTDTPITDLLQGKVVNLGIVAPTSVTVQVVVSGYKVSSVKITLDGATFIQKVESGTYALCGNSGSDFSPCKNLKLGNYNIKAELYSGYSATGSIVASSQLDFILANTVPTSPITPAPISPITPAPISPIAPPMQAPTAAPIPISTSCTIPKVRKDQCFTR